MSHHLPYRTLAWLAAAVALSLPARGTIGETLVYRGEHPYSQRELDAILRVASDVPVTPEAVADAMPGLMERCVEDGYFEALARLFRDADLLVLELQVGPRVVADAPVVTGAPHEVHDELEAELGEGAGRPLRGVDVERRLRSSALRLSEAGFPFAEVRATEFARDGERLLYRVQVEPGKVVVMDSLRVGGLKVTRPLTAERIAGFTPGGRYRESERSAIRTRLLRSGIFARVSDVDLRILPDGGTGVYELTVEEGPSTWLHGAIGVGGQGREVNGLVDVALTNLFGTARVFKALWEGRGEGRAFYRLAYREPWILGWPLAASGQFEQEQEGQVFTRTDWIGELELAVVERLAVRLGWQSHESVSPSGAVSRSLRRSSRFGFAWDSRDDPVAPRTGSLLDVTATRGDQKDERRDGPPIKRPVTTLETRVEAVPWAGRRNAFYVGLTGFLRDARGETLRPENLYAVGGAASLRGYEEKRFRTGLGAVGSFEARRYLRQDGTRVFLFVDAGVFDPDRTMGTGGDRWKLSGGLGLRVGSRVGLVGIDFAASEEIASYEEIRMHFSVVGRY